MPIRSADGEVLDGVEIEDCGDKMGLQGVDNGRSRRLCCRTAPDDSRALQTKVNVLCADLRPQALTLVAGFGIPDALLRAPIATAV